MTTLPPVAAPTRRMRSRLADIIERLLWTLVQTVGAVELRDIWNNLDLGPDLGIQWIPVIAGGLALIKGTLASRFGNGSASTLPDTLEPVPSDRVVAQESPSGLVVAGHARVDDGAKGDIPAGTPVDVDPIEDLGVEDDANLPDKGDDPTNEGLEMPEGFDDGSRLS